MSTTETEVEDLTEMVVAPFAVEVDHPRNMNLLLQAIPGCRLRTAISGTKMVLDAKTGEPRLPKDQANALATFPPTPGQVLSVDPKTLTYKIVDPLRGDKTLIDRIKAHLKERGRPVQDLDGLPTLEGTLDVHRMKNLCREVFRLIDLKHMKLIKGPKLRMEDIDDLPGNYLLNPGTQIPNTQPTYEKDYDAWVAALS